MNPNSANQRWSLWEYRVYPDVTKRPDFQTVKVNCARFGRLVFGSVSEMRIEERSYWEIAVLTEGHPVHDPVYTEWIHAQWRKFFQEGFGSACVVQCHARLEAGDRQDGKPADQLIIMPSRIAEGAVGWPTSCSQPSKKAF